MKRGDSDSDTHAGRTPRENEGGDLVMQLQANERRRASTDHQKLEEGHGPDSTSQPSEGTNPADTLILNFQPPEL